MSKPCYVYFIKPIGMDGPIKIGHSKAPKERLVAFSVWSPFPLEIVGTVPGDSREENWLHRCFSDHHSHREWFRSSPKLREAIRLILEAGNADAAMPYLEPKPPRGRKAEIVRHPRRQRFVDMNRTVETAERALRATKVVNWHRPADVAKIVRRWTSQEYSGGGWAPTDAEMARVQEYLSDPPAHSVRPEWEKKFDEMAAERQAAKIEADFERTAERSVA